MSSFGNDSWPSTSSSSTSAANELINRPLVLPLSPLDLDKFDDQWFQMFSPSYQLAPEEIDELRQTLDEDPAPQAGPTDDPSHHPPPPPRSQTPQSSSRSSLELLHRYGGGGGGNRASSSSSGHSTTTHSPRRPLTPEEALRIAGKRIVQFSSGKAGAPSMLNIPFDPSLSHLSGDDVRSVELAEYLLAAAERVGDKQFDHAAALLNLCESLASKTGNPVQRLGYCFCQALREKIACDTGNKPPHEKLRSVPDLYETMVTTSDFAVKAMQCGTMPMFQVPHIVGIQAIIENVTKTNKIHVIDLKIGNGHQWVALMQGITSWSDRDPIELLRVTAVATTSSNQSSINDTGSRLTSFAETIKVPFQFSVVMVTDEEGASDFRPDRFDLDPVEEDLVVYSERVLRTMIGQPRRLEHMMRVIKRMNPRVMVTVEVEANLNSPSFTGRFVEAIFHYGAIFDNLESCMARDNPNRLRIETTLLGHHVGNILASEGADRYVRSVNLDVWRKFFARFGMVEIEPSLTATHQAKWFIEKFTSPQPYSIESNEKSLILGFNGTPLLSVSTWKFIQFARLISDNQELRVEFY